MLSHVNIIIVMMDWYVLYLYFGISMLVYKGAYDDRQRSKEKHT